MSTENNNHNSIAGQFKTTNSADASQFVNILVYGAVGLGKTVFGATGPGPVFYMDLDDGLLSVRRIKPDLGQELGIDTNQIYSQRIRKYDELIRTMEKLHNCRNFKDYFGTIVFDNITVAQVFCLSQRIGMKEAMSVEKLPERTDWNLVLQQMRAIITFVRDLPANTVFIAHEQFKDNMIGPMIQGSAYKQIPGLVDLMARYTIFEKEDDDGKGGKTTREVRALNFKPVSPIPGIRAGIEAKNRGGWLNDLEKPHLGRIIEKIYPKVEVEKQKG